MRVLLTGANGFIGSGIASALAEAGHEVVAATRTADRVCQVAVDTRIIDFSTAAHGDDWSSRLADIDAVINCAGVLLTTRSADAWAVNAHGPKVLFDACERAGIRRVIQISAISADAAAGGEFALSKLAADDHLRSLDLDWIVLRPSLVYAQGSYGGSSALRGLAGLPGIIPLVGDEDSAFQPLHVDDLAAGILWLLDHPDVVGNTFEPVGPDRLNVVEMVRYYRKWLGFGTAWIFMLPRLIQNGLAAIGDWFGVAAINRVSLRQLRYGNTSDDDWTASVPVRTRRLADDMAAHPATVQDRWHARLYFFKPVIRVSLTALWFGSALAGVFVPEQQVSQWLEPYRLQDYAAAFKWLSIGVDAVLGVWLASGAAIKACLIAQFWLVAIYTVVFAVADPGLMVAPLGEWLKNIPILALVGVAWAIADER